MTPIKVTGRILPISEDTRRRNPELYPAIAPGCPTTSQDGLRHGSNPGKVKKRLRQGSKPLLNKLETEYKERIGSPLHVYPQAIRFRLCNGVTYTPDFVAIDPMSRVYCYEVKGKHAWEDAMIKLKVAAKEYPRFIWTLAWKENGQWVEQTILP